MKDIFHYAALLCFCFIFGCSPDDDGSALQCPKPFGKLSTLINGKLPFDSNLVSFVEVGANSVKIAAEEYTPQCIAIGAVSFSVEKNLGTQVLIRDNRNTIEEIGESFFLEIDEDVILGRYGIYETEENFVEITSIDDEKIIGRLTATYVWEVGPNKFITLPDTLRFNNAPFEALSQDLLPPN